jgi:hypothetical protein
MAKKQTRRSISVSRTTYERLKAFCESNNISMSQLVENRVNDFLGGDTIVPATTPSHPARPTPAPSAPRPVAPQPATPKPVSEAAARPVMASAPAPSASMAVPMTSAAARYAVDPPPPVIKPKQQENAPKPTEKRADQIFTF